MKKIFFIILTILTGTFSAQTFSLETMAQYEPGNMPKADYAKDLNGLLNKYVGTWKGTLDGKTYEFNIVKKENITIEFSNTKWDKLVGRVKIIDSNGSILFNNFNKTDNDTGLGYNFQKDLKLYLMRFNGEKINCIDDGFIYINVKSETPNKMTINFYPDNDIVTEDCSNFKTTMPTNKTIHLTKQ